MNLVLKKTLLKKAFVSGIISLVITIIWMSSPLTIGDELLVLKWLSLVKKDLLGIENNIEKNDFLFIDVSKNKTTIPTSNWFSDSSRFDNEVVVDRADLAKLFKLMLKYNKDIPILMCNVLFEKKQEQDSALNGLFKGFKKNLFVAARSEKKNGKIIEPILSANYGLTNYESPNDMLFKYPIMVSTEKGKIPSLAAKSYGYIDKVEIKSFLRFAIADNRLIFSNMVFDNYIEQSDLKVGEEKSFTTMSIGEVFESLEFSSDTATLFKNRIIVIGDFEKKVKTVYGDMSYPLVTANAFLSLREGRNSVTFWWLITMVIGYIIISYQLFLVEHAEGEKEELTLKKQIRMYLQEILKDYKFHLVLLTSLSFFLFNFSINILIIIVWFKIMKIGLKFFERWKSAIRITN